MFGNKKVKATVYEVASCFHPRGMLGSETAEVGIYLLREKYKGSEKLIVPYWVCVC